MAKEFFKAIKESVMASNAYGRDVNPRASTYSSSRDEEQRREESRREEQRREEQRREEPRREEPRREEARREEPRREEQRREEPWQQRQAAKPFADAPTESPATGRTLSVIGPTLVFKGKLVAEEDVLIQGRVEGSITHTAT